VTVSLLFFVRECLWTTGHDGFRCVYIVVVGSDVVVIVILLVPMAAAEEDGGVAS